LPGYFQTLRIPLLKGRDFTANDTEDKPRIAIINATMARLFWPNQDAVGKRFSQDKQHPNWITVVGVVGDVRQRGLATAAAPESFFPMPQENRNSMVIVARTANKPLDQLPAVSGAVHELDSNCRFFSRANSPRSCRSPQSEIASSRCCWAFSRPSRSCWRPWGSTASSPIR
jgi:hypothetical protein